MDFGPEDAAWYLAAVRIHTPEGSSSQVVRVPLACACGPEDKCTLLRDYKEFLTYVGLELVEAPRKTHDEVMEYVDKIATEEEKRFGMFMKRMFLVWEQEQAFLEVTKHVQDKLVRWSKGKPHVH